MGVVEELHGQQAEAIAAIEAASDLGALDAVRVGVLGKKGSLTSVLRGLGTLPPEERPAVGKTANEVRVAIEEALEARRVQLSAAALEARVTAEAVDVTLPGRARPVGRQHLISRITAEAIDVFLGLGYRVAEGPEVELDYYNFTALNTPPDHPARSLADTFYVHDLSGDEAAVTGESDVLLRTHTSPVQVRTMEREKPPIYILSPGRVYRRDIADPSHLPQFHQIEGLVVDEGITFADLKGTLDHFVKAMFGPDRKTRFRPHFFPFTEPSAEVDVSCGICAGVGCRFCKNTGWLEILGCGMVDPNVFGYVGIDPERYTGFAFGMGVERIAALKYNLPDLRMLVEGDMRFLRQL
ncbi:MAG TPA: phenylalanine--tRNA ligase subunit alpha [Coriobacteriia bacterium]|nr:phenylalanine--tRNA ligase subunit alpha [Coriobacteriia bacterium]